LIFIACSKPTGTEEGARKCFLESKGFCYNNKFFDTMKPFEGICDLSIDEYMKKVGKLIIV
jgi:hypothetical protein